MTRFKMWSKFVAAPGLGLCAAMLGCGVTSSNSGPVQGAILQGTMHGGQQPISGASVALYAAGTAGYGTGAMSLLTTPVTTNTAGEFTITGDYTCPSSTSQLYLIGTGGNPGLGAGVTNSSIALMAALGPCSLNGGQYTLSPSLFVSVNELTTVASVYALRGFMAPNSSQVGTSGGNALGLANAFQTVNNLVNVQTGAALSSTPAGNGTVPQEEIYTLADAIATCVNSNGTDGSCAALFSAATPAGVTTAPTDTIQALYNIASYPSSKVSTIWGLAAAAAPYESTLPAVPNDWTVQVVYTGGNSIVTASFVSGNPLAVDAQGDLWSLGDSNGQPVGILNYSNLGVLQSPVNGYPAGGLSQPTGIAIDPAGNVWVADQAAGDIVKMNSSGGVMSGSTGFTGGGLKRPEGIAIDGSGNVWTPDTAAQAVIELNNMGAIQSGPSGYPATVGGGIALDKTGNIWGLASSTAAFEMNSSGTVLAGAYSLGSVNMGQIAFDGTSHLWATAEPQSTVAAKLSTGGMLNSPASGYPTCTPAYNPNVSGRSCFWSYGQPFAMDGGGNMWVNSDAIVSSGGRSPSYTYTTGIAELSNSGTILSGSKGYATTLNAAGIAVDQSGNVWISSNGLIELVGAGSPVVQPLSVGVKNGTLGMMP